MNPEGIIFDEPTAGLDPRTQQWLIELIVDLNRAGKTIILATHDLSTLTKIADRCVVFSEDHRIVADGSADTIVCDRPLLLSVNLIHEHTHVHTVDGPDGTSAQLRHRHQHSHHSEPVPAATS